MTNGLNDSQANVIPLREALLQWYDKHARTLAWRVHGGKADPYHVWLSEVMLQQTTVAHAKAYFDKFLANWPRIECLARAPDHDIMAAWAGLGYYSRARNLLACARHLVDNYGGEFPQTETALKALPGIGAYTAAAIMAFGFGQPANVVDGNIERIMSRFYAVNTPWPQSKPELIRYAALWVQDHRASDWPQALMDLASLICRPKNPLCDQCPWSEACAARLSQNPDQFPIKLVKQAKPTRYGLAYVVHCEGQIIAEQRPPMGLLGGMLGLPHLEWRDTPYETKDYVADRPWIDCGQHSHVFTHFRLWQKVVYRTCDKAEFQQLLKDNPKCQALALSQAKSLPSVFAKALGLALIHIGADATS